MIKKIARILSIAIPVVLLSIYFAWSINIVMQDISESTYCGIIISKDRSYRSSYFEFGVKWDVGHVNTYSVDSISYNTKTIGDRICVTDEWKRIYPEGSNGFREIPSIFGVYILFVGILIGFIYLIIAMYKKIWREGNQ